MQEARCKAAHPRIPGKVCEAKLIREYELPPGGYIVIDCWRCHEPQVIAGPVATEAVDTLVLAR